MRYVFISHADVDKPRIAPLLQHLVHRGIPLWIDRRETLDLTPNPLVAGIETGADWDLSIRQACEKATCILFILSRNSNNLSRSDQLFREYERAIKDGKLVLAKIDEIPSEDLQGAFRIRQAIDLTHLSDAELLWNDKAVEFLLSSLREFLFSNRTLPEDIACLKSGIDGLAEMVRLIGDDLGDATKAAAFEHAHWNVKHGTISQLREHRLRFNPGRSDRFTYFDIFNNICNMIYLRQDAAMVIRDLLRQVNPTQEQINQTCSELYDTLDALRRLIKDFYNIARELNDERYLRLPVSMHKMMAETNFAINALIHRLGFGEPTQRNYTHLLADAASRAQIEELCDHLEKTVKFLCEINADATHINDFKLPSR